MLDTLDNRFRNDLLAMLPQMEGGMSGALSKEFDKALAPRMHELEQQAAQYAEEGKAIPEDLQGMIAALRAVENIANAYRLIDDTVYSYRAELMTSTNPILTYNQMGITSTPLAKIPGSTSSQSTGAGGYIPGSGVPIPNIAEQLSAQAMETEQASQTLQTVLSNAALVIAPLAMGVLAALSNGEGEQDAMVPPN